jgi:hypothetical protein
MHHSFVPRHRKFGCGSGEGLIARRPGKSAAGSARMSASGNIWPAWRWHARLNALLDRLPNLHLDPEFSPPQIRGLGMRALAEMRVRFG